MPSEPLDCLAKLPSQPRCAFNKSCTHPKCGSKSDHQPPTRVLDINSLKHNHSVRLVPGTQLGDAQYATLSYWWGGYQEFVLTQENVLSFQQGIPLSLFPRTFLEAVSVCRQLGIHFLWIDALCITQGEDDDCADEIPRMDSVYAGSVLTIAVADAEHSNEGFLCSRSPLRYQPCQIDSDDFTTLLVEHHRPRRWSLDQRGWVLQERLLSPRTVYYGQYGLHWECRRGTICENNPSFETASTRDNGHYRHENIKNIYIKLQEAPRVTKALLLFWYKVIKVYSKTSLSYEEDKLAALAGVARCFQPRLRVQASFGLWLDYFVLELIWITDSFERRSTNPIFDRTHHLDLAPSWSWACLRGTSVANMFWNYGRSDASPWSTASVSNLPSPTHFERLRPIPHNEQSIAFSMRIKGQFRRCKLNESKYFFLDPFRADEAKHPRGYGRIFPDMPIVDEKMEMYCLKLVRIPSGDGFDGSSVGADYGIVLTPSEHNRSQYRRVGLFIEAYYSDLVHRMFPAHIPCSVIEVI